MIHEEIVCLYLFTYIMQKQIKMQAKLYHPYPKIRNNCMILNYTIEMMDGLKSYLDKRWRQLYIGWIEIPIRLKVRLMKIAVFKW